MSVMVLGFESFGNVRKTLGSVSIREGANAVDVCERLGVRNGRTPEAINKMFAAIDEFVHDCYKWNCKAYELRYETKCDHTDAEWNAICNRGEIVSKAQLFQTLSCIHYNSDIREYMDNEEYENTPFLPMKFEKWWTKLENLIDELAKSIVWDKCDEEGCKWG